jgi:hypothetical protein
MTPTKDVPNRTTLDGAVNIANDAPFNNPSAFKLVVAFMED